MITTPQSDDSFTMPTPASQRRLLAYLEAAQAAGSTDFPGLMLMSLMCYVEDDLRQEAIDDALHTLSGGAA